MAAVGRRSARRPSWLDHLLLARHNGARTALHHRLLGDLHWYFRGDDSHFTQTGDRERVADGIERCAFDPFWIGAGGVARGGGALAGVAGWHLRGWFWDSPCSSRL